MNNLLYEKSSQYFWPSFVFLAIPKHGSLARHILCYVCLLYVYEGEYAKKLKKMKNKKLKKKKKFEEEFFSLLFMTLLDYCYRLHVIRNTVSNDQHICFYVPLSLRVSS